ncbi:hypothetical protein ACGFZP_13280 [Kitasatospora sp. NPDC048239]|uniref:hypothetical protein n=1 Tax=Kitasatospora sp. NPDC048239 TaxID=3364046 RepID=UPI00371C184E
MVDHVDDLEADFQAHYGLDQAELDGPRWVRLAQRVAAYGGVMARRIEEQRDAGQPMQQPPANSGEREMDLTELRLAHPGLVSVTRVAD